MSNKNILLSIAMIFKNEIRCLERCLSSFAPLREAIPCELVMADTGSDDGSREVAEKYADILFDFTWVNDFSAARNAVLDRCSGKWILTVDADEWMDKDISQIIAFLRSSGQTPDGIGSIKICNYTDDDLSWRHVDFMAVRMIQRASGYRYIGAVHEHWNNRDGVTIYPLYDTILHHDGYVCLNNGSLAGEEKAKRNRLLLERELEQDPHNLRILMQCIENCTGVSYSNVEPYIRRALQGVEEKWPRWNECGASILRHAVYFAKHNDLPEFSEWLSMAEEMFPDSFFTKTDIQYYAAEHAWVKMNCAEVIHRGELYLRGLKEYREKGMVSNEMMLGCANSVLPHHETSIRAFISRAYLYVGQPKKAVDTLRTLDYESMDERQVGDLMMSMLAIHALSEVDTASLVQDFWEGISKPIPSREQADKRKQKFMFYAFSVLKIEFLKDERKRMEFGGNNIVLDLNKLRAEEWGELTKQKVFRRAYTLFLPLEGKCELGRAAAILECEDVPALSEKLSEVENWIEMPISALAHALERDTYFPIPGKPLKIEEMDSLAARLSQAPETLIKLALRPYYVENGQSLCWARALIMSAVQNCKWAKMDHGMELTRAFVDMERIFLPLCYTPTMLTEENDFMLPPVHRFGRYCIQAFDALDSGDTAGYVRFLHSGLSACENMKDMVEYLVDVTEHQENVMAAAPPELMALAKQVRTILDRYSPDDPAVVELKASAVYQKVAWLIEDPASVPGGLAQ